MTDRELPQPSNDEERSAEINRQVARGAMWVALARWGTLLLSWPVTIVVARYLSPFDYGMVAVVYVIAQLGRVVAEGGAPSAVILGPRLDEGQYQLLHGWSYKLHATVGAVLVLLAVPVEHAYQQVGLRWVMAAVGATFFLEGLAVVPVARMRRDLDLGTVSWLNALRSIAESLTTLAAAIAGFEYWALILGYITGVTVYTALVLARSRMIPRFRGDEGIRDVVVNAKQLLVGTAASYLAHSADAILGALVVATKPLGGYRFMLSISQAPVERLSGIQVYASASLFGNVRDDDEQLKRYLSFLLKITATVLYPALIGIALTADGLVKVVLSEQWSPYAGVLVVMSIYSLVPPVLSTINMVVVAKDGSKVQLRNGITQLLVLPPAFLALGYMFGALGLAFAWFIPVPIVAARTIRSSKQAVKFGWRELGHSLQGPLLGASVMAAAVSLWSHIARSYLGLDVALLLASQVLLGVVTYLPIAFIYSRREIGRMVSLARSGRRQPPPVA